VDARGFRLMPHGKTTMAPALWRAQLDAGARGLTLATTSQVRTALRLGFTELMLANELVSAPALRWIAGQLADPAVRLTCWTDSAAGVARMEGGAGRTGPGARPAARGVRGARGARRPHRGSEHRRGRGPRRARRRLPGAAPGRGGRVRGRRGARPLGGGRGGRRRPPGADARPAPTPGGAVRRAGGHGLGRREPVVRPRGRGLLSGPAGRPRPGV